MTAPAKVRVEVFSKPCLFDDNFYKNWTSTATLTTDGDLATITSLGSSEYTTTYNFSSTKNTNPNRYLTLWATAVNLTTGYAIKIYYNTTLKVSKSYTTTGIKEIDLYTEF